MDIMDTSAQRHVRADNYNDRVGLLVSVNKAFEQLWLIEGEMLNLQTRYDRAEKEQQERFLTSLAVRIVILRSMREVYLKYIMKKTERLIPGFLAIGPSS